MHQPLQIHISQHRPVVEEQPWQNGDRERSPGEQTPRPSHVQHSSAHGPDPLLDQALDQMMPIVPYTSAAILMLSQDKLEVRAWRGQPDQRLIVGASVRLGQSPMLQAMLATRQAFVIADLSAEATGVQLSAAFNGWTARQRAWLGVPLVLHEEVIGMLILWHTVPDSYTSRDLDCARAFAIPLAIVLAHSQQSHRAQAVAVDAERARIARDLHDAVTQTLFSASLIAEALPGVWQRSPEKGQRGLQELRQLTRNALAEMRTLLIDLHPAALTTKPLGELLRHLSGTLMGRTQIPVKLQMDAACRLPSEVQVTLYRIAQEGLNNILKHAQASEVVLELAAHPTGVTLCIQDNGRGFDPSELLLGSLGLGMMRERAAQIGAGLQIDSQPGHGTRIAVAWAGPMNACEETGPADSSHREPRAW